MAVSALLGSVVALSSAAAAASPAGGKVNVFGSAKNSSATLLFTGAIGDAGRAVQINANGTPNPNGNYLRFTLKHGTFEGNATGLNTAINKAKFSFNSATCSGFGGGSGPVTLFDGTGSYAGISGTLHVTVTFAEVAPRYTSGKHKGQCNQNQNATPVAQYTAVAGSGTVSF
jgi:hypothetical protein